MAGDADTLGFKSDRLIAFSDGVFGVALTVLIVTVIDNFPGLNNVIVEEKDRFIVALIRDRLPTLLMWLLSAVVVGTFWIAHHNVFALINRTNRLLLWLNVFFLIPVTFVPLSVHLVALGWTGKVEASIPRLTYSDTALLVYALNLLVCSVALFTLWTYATRHGGLVHDVEASLIANVKQRMRIGILLYSIAAALAAVAWPLAVDTGTIVSRAGRASARGTGTDLITR
jgi:uncharacterized membrane protein